MALIDDVKTICDRIADAGWRDLLLKHGIDIRQPSAASLATELAKTVNVDLTIPGFEDFVSRTAKGIEPGNVAGSLLYHALASPLVQRVPSNATAAGTLSTALTLFPTLAELDTVENCIYSKADRDLAAVQSLAENLLESNSVELAIAVFATEYRPAKETPHQRYADLCLSRTGVSRVGSASAAYIGSLRGFVPFLDGDVTHSIRVLPCRYSTWIAARSKRKEGRFGPARPEARDADSQYWVPVHKLFNGTECLANEDLEVTLSALHQNRKIERIHSHMEANNISTGFSDLQKTQDPFVKEHGLADWGEVFSGGGRVLSPQPQPLAERANFENEHLSFPAPPMQGSFSPAFSPTFSLNVPGVPIRPWPEYAHVRFEVENGSAVYFGDDSGVEAKATTGNYRALNISDSTADGWVKAEVASLSQLESISGYSLVAAPDFFPGVSQREVFEWWVDIQRPDVLPTLPLWLQGILNEGFWDFWRARPVPLSDTPFAPNVNLSNSNFDEDDITVTAVVSPLQEVDISKAKLDTRTSLRHSALPDSAAGVFAPGWDVSADRVAGTQKTHLSAYGLGSPFPEDAKLCAALSTFWPAAAPDTARTYFKVDFAKGTVCPLTDEENGAADGSVSWDGLKGPRVISEDGTKTRVRYTNYPLADYTMNALEGKFSIAETRKIGFSEYTNRILATLRMYRALKNVGNRNTLHIMSFQKLNSDDDTLVEAQDESGRQLSGPVYRFDVFAQNKATTVNNGDVRIEDFDVSEILTLLIGSSDFLLAQVREGDGSVTRSIWNDVSA